MAVRTIIEVPDKRLKTVSDPVAAVTGETRALMDDMLETMYASNGIGLAAIQIGVPQRVIVMDLSPSATEDDEDGDAETETADYGFLLSVVIPELDYFYAGVAFAKFPEGRPGLRALRAVVNEYYLIRNSFKGFL